MFVYKYFSQLFIFEIIFPLSFDTVFTIVSGKTSHDNCYMDLCINDQKEHLKQESNYKISKLSFR